jgi:hypothetical protein
VFPFASITVAVITSVEELFATGLELAAESLTAEATP